jgi:hypothetical protein
LASSVFVPQKLGLACQTSVKNNNSQDDIIDIFHKELEEKLN